MPAPDDDRRKVEWDIAAAPRNYLTVLVTQAVSLGASFFVMGVLTRALGAAGYGEIAAMVAATMLSIQLAFQWSAPAMSRFAAIEFVETGRIGHTFWSRALLVGATIVITLVTTPLWLPVLCRAFHLAPHDGRALVFYVLAQVTWLHVQSALLAVKLPRHQSLLLTVERLLCLGALLLLRSRLAPGLVIATYASMSLLVSALGMVSVWRFLGRVEPRHGGLRRLVAYSLPLVLTTLVSYLSTSYLDTLFLVKYVSMTEVGNYAAVAQVAGSFLQLALIGGTLVLPALLSQAAVRQAAWVTANFVRTLFPVLSLAWAAACVVLALVGPPLVRLLFGSRFGDPSTLLPVLLVVAAATGPVLLGLLPAAHVLERPRIIAINAVVLAALNVALDLLLIPRAGLLGCAWASALAAILSFLVTWWLVARATPEPLRVQTVLVVVPSLLAATMRELGAHALWEAVVSLGALAALALFARAELTSVVQRLLEVRRARSS